MKYGAVICIGAILWAAPAVAGFEFMPETAKRPAPASASAPSAYAPVRGSAPNGLLTPEPPAGRMPAIATVPVIAEPLAPPPSGRADRVLNRNISTAQDPLRINPAPLRPRPAPVRAQSTQPFDGDAFLDAAILGEGAPAMARPAASGLTINPYPLQSATAATTHADAEMNMQIERGMMEANGQLRPVAVPGKRMSGLERAQQAAAEAAAFDPASYDAQDGEIVEMTIAPPPRKPSIPQIAARAPSGRPAAHQHQQTASSSPAPVRAAPAQPQSYPEAVGFGRDLPLALALRQIVPAEYNYSFAQNIDLGANVSWEGGKPWNEVLQDMLSGTGFYADIRGNEVRIRNMNS